MKRPPPRSPKADIARLDAIKAAIDRDDYSRAVSLSRPLALLGEPNANRYLGHSLYKMGYLDGARAALNAVLKHTPQDALTEYNLAMMDLAAGDWETGFRRFEVRHRVRPVPGYVAKLGEAWQGASLRERTILVYADQGFGDAIQFVRYLALLKDAGAEVVLAAHPELRSLLEPLPSVDRYISTGDAVPSLDAYISIMSLPGVFGVRPDRVIVQAPYIELPPAQLNGGVGLVWAGNRTDAQDRFRSLPPSVLGDLIEALGGLKVYSLQKIGEDELETVPHAGGVIRLGRTFADFADTARAIAGLELVITVDTAVAHLAGALGKPVWLLLHTTPDWRWLRSRSDTPWYPTMRIFRQSKLGDWDSVMTDVKSALMDTFHKVSAI